MPIPANAAILKKFRDSPFFVIAIVRADDKLACVVIENTKAKERTMSSYKVSENDERFFVQVGSAAKIVSKWFGYKRLGSRKSPRMTWNETLIASGPYEWVLKEFKKTASIYGVSI